MNRSTSWLGTGIMALGLVLVLAANATAQDGDMAPFVGVTASGEERPFTLLHTDVAAELVSGYAQVVLTQTFQNPYTEPLEGIYRFPLPHDGAVDRVAMIIGMRMIEGEVREREEARQIYEEARDAGQHAALTEEERPNVFTQSVANIMPGEEILVTIRYVAPLKLEEGEYGFVLPTVVGPRYIPAAHAGSAAMANVNPAVLRPGETSDHELDLELHIRPGVPLFGVYSPTHEIVVQPNSPTEATVTLAPYDRLPNKDIVVRYRVAGKSAEAGLLAHREGKRGTFSLVVEPPAPDTEPEVVPREMIFVVDTSGSMMGEPIEKAKAVMRHAVRTMGADDTFQVINFSSDASSLSPTPLVNTPDNVAKAVRHIDTLAGEGGTEMLSGIRAALSGEPGHGRLRIVLFMTDGYIGNDAEVLRYVGANIGNARLFSLGVGSSVNRYLLDRLAEMGRGAVEYVTPYEDEQVAVDRFYARIAAPVLTDITVDWDGLKVEDVIPARVPDLFLGQPLRVIGRYAKSGAATVRIHGKQGGRDVTLTVPVELPAQRRENGLLDTVWAKARIQQLEGPNEWETTAETTAEITRLGIEHHLLTTYTSMVAVERDIVANPTPDQLRTALAAVYLPDGVAHAGIFGEAKPPALLSPDRIMPGDPEILVHAPRDARRVMAILPWGETLECVWLEREQAFMARFLVPREAAEGLYRIRVFVEASDGAKQDYTLFYRVDFTAPTMHLELSAEEVAAGQTLSLRAVPIEGVYEGKAVRKVGGVLVRMRTDVKRVTARLGETVVTLEQTKRGDAWEGELVVPELLAGAYEMELVVTDYSGNVHRDARKVVVR